MIQRTQEKEREVVTRNHERKLHHETFVYLTIALILILASIAIYNILVYQQQEVIEQIKQLMTDFFSKSFLAELCVSQVSLRNVVDEFVETNANIFRDSALETNQIISMVTFANSIFASSYLVILQLSKSKRFGLSPDSIPQYRRFRTIADYSNLLSFLMIPICLFFHVRRMNVQLLVACYLNFTLVAVTIVISNHLNKENILENATYKRYQELWLHEEKKWSKAVRKCFQQAFQANKITDDGAFDFVIRLIYEALLQLYMDKSVNISNCSNKVNAMEKFITDIENDNALDLFTFRLFDECSEEHSSFLSEVGTRIVFLWGLFLLRRREHEPESERVSINEVVEKFCVRLRRDCSRDSSAYNSICRYYIEAQQIKQRSPVSYSEEFSRLHSLVRSK